MASQVCAAVVARTADQTTLSSIEQAGRASTSTPGPIDGHARNKSSRMIASQSLSAEPCLALLGSSAISGQAPQAQYDSPPAGLTPSLTSRHPRARACNCQPAERCCPAPEPAARPVLCRNRPGTRPPKHSICPASGRRARGVGIDCYDETLTLPTTKTACCPLKIPVA